MCREPAHLVGNSGAREAVPKAGEHDRQDVVIFLAAYIVDEIEHVVRDFGVRDIAFVDSLFWANKKRVHAVCDQILRRGVKVSWTCSSRVEVVDKPLLEKMKRAGCWRTRFGVESGSESLSASCGCQSWTTKTTR